jgi:hypothetical protein
VKVKVKKKSYNWVNLVLLVDESRPALDLIEYFYFIPVVTKSKT